MKKRFPADCRLEKELKQIHSKNFKTFLNDKKVDGELYAFFQSISKSYTLDRKLGMHETRVYKEDIPTVTKIIQKIGVKSRSTYYSHLSYLIEVGLITEYEDYYLLNNKEDFYLLIPLETLQTLLVGVSEYTIKTYIYLGTMWNWKKTNFVFTYKDIAEHIGIKIDNNTRRYDDIKRILLVLQKLELIDFEEFYEKNDNAAGIIPKKRLTKLAFEIPPYKK